MAAPALNRAGRQARIVELIRDRAVHSQAELLGLLVAEGIETTQATVSRDLDELGAIKVRGAYVIPDDGSPVRGVEGGTARLARLLGDLLVSRGLEWEPGRAAHPARGRALPGQRPRPRRTARRRRHDRGRRHPPGGGP